MPPSRQRGAYDAGTPIRFVGPACPPTFLLHGALDPVADPKDTVVLDEALSKARARHGLLIIPRGKHANFLRNQAVWDFLAAELKP
jgi:acetyl esterase/lipase